MAEQERKKNRQRQAEGIEVAKADGVKFGRPKQEIDSNFIQVYKEWKSQEEFSFIGGFQNFIYSCTREGCKYILRFTPSTLRTHEGLVAKLEWIRYLAENGMSVSEPVSSAQGMDIEHISGKMIDFYVTSFRHAPGRKIGYPECLGNPLLYEQCGRMTSHLHELAKRHEPLTRRHSWERNEYLLQARKYIPPEHTPILNALDELKERLASLPVSKDNFGLIHGDIN